MGALREPLSRPIRVVVFGGGPVLLYGIKQFICRLEAHPDIELTAVICQSPDPSFRGIVRDLWRRRGMLALPLLLMFYGGRLLRFLRRPGVEIKLRRQLARIAGRSEFVRDIHDPKVLAQVRALQADLGLIYGSPILKPALFEIPAYGTLGIHHGKMPEYRGKKTTFWAMFNGEASAGVTIQKVNAGLDTGEIVQQGEVAVKGRSLRSVWNELEALGLALYLQAILEIRQGTATYQPASGKKGKLYRDPGWRDILAFWRKQVMRKLNI